MQLVDKYKIYIVHFKQILTSGWFQ